MDAQLLRLAWALPLVLLIGVGAMLLLKRMGIGVGPRSSSGGNGSNATYVPQLVSTTQLTEHTQALVVEFDSQRWVVFESTAQIAVQAPAPANASMPDSARRP